MSNLVLGQLLVCVNFYELSSSSFPLQTKRTTATCIGVDAGWTWNSSPISTHGMLVLVCALLTNIDGW